jgi:WD40 repeat protein
VTKLPVVAPASPYKGLAAFEDTELDALLFFGRAADSEMIAANLLASRFTVLAGAPGVGKSSVIRAGVVRRVRSLAPDDLVVVHDSWARDPVQGLLGAVTAAAPGFAPAESDAPLAERLAELADGFGGRLYLILDQFEELFVYDGADTLADELSQVVTRPKLRANVLVAVRDDALFELDVFTGRIPDVFGNYLALARLDRGAGRAAITGPIARYNELSPEHPVHIDLDLVEAVLDEVEVGRVALGGVARGASEVLGGGIEAPYLQLVMQRIWEAERAHGSSALRRAALEELGGAQEIVRAHLDHALAALPPGERDMAARVFNHLVTPSGSKIAHSVADLAEYAGVREEELHPVLASLGADRILRPLDGRFEIFHDVLADAVLEWRTRHEAARALERQRAESDRRHRRLLAALASALIAVVAMVAVTVYALTQRSEAREQAAATRAEARRANARSLDAQASVLIPVAPAEVDPELGLLLAAEAARLSPTPQTEDILRRALLVSHLRRVLPERRVTAASFVGNRILVGSADGIVRAYTDNARTRLTTLAVGRPVTGVAASSDGRFTLTTERGGPARLWDAAGGEALRSFGRAPVRASLSPDGTLVLTVEEGGARIWRASDGTALAMLRQPDRVQQASFGPRGVLVAAIGTGRLARVFVARTGRLVATVDQGGSITSAILTPDERTLITTGKNRTARAWSIQRGGRLLHEFRGHRGQVTAAALSADGTLLATTSTDGTARVWVVATGSLVTDVGGHTNFVTGAKFSRDGSSLVTWSTDRTARVWRSVRGSARAVLRPHGDAVTDASFGASGDTLLTTSGDGRARLWSPLEARLRRVTAAPTPIATASFSGDRRLVAVAGGTGVSVVDSVTGRHVALLAAGPVRVLSMSGDGALLAVARDRRVSIWRTATRMLAGTVDAGAPVTAVAFSPDGRTIAIGTADGAIGAWTAAGRRTATLVALRERVTSLAFGPAGARLAAGFGNGVVAAWSLRNGRRLYLRQSHRSGTAVKSVAFSSSGRRIVTAGNDSQIRVSSATSGSESQTLRGHFGPVSGAAFSSDGRWVLTAGPETAGLWDLVNRQRLLFLEGHVGRVVAASFDAAGRRITTVGIDGTVRSYACETCGSIPDLLRLAERRLAATGRRLTPAERRRYLGGA